MFTLYYIVFHCILTRTRWGCFNLQMEEMRLREIQSLTQPSHPASKWQRPDLNQGSRLGTCTLIYSFVSREIRGHPIPISLLTLILPPWTVPRGGGVLWEALWMLLYNTCKANKGYLNHLLQVFLLAHFFPLRVSRVKHKNIGKGAKYLLIPVSIEICLILLHTCLEAQGLQKEALDED